MRTKNPGRIVKHEDGRTGIIYNRDQWVNGKPLVHFNGEKAVFIDPSKLKAIGFID